MADKTAIIMSGGGMSCSYGVGVLLALVEKYNFKKPDIVITGSGSAGTLSYYVAEQYDSIKNIWLNLLSTKKFINPFRLSKIIDIDYLIDEVFKKQDVLNEKKIYDSKTTYLICATNYDTGNIEYFSNKNKDDIFEAMRATKAMPIVYNKKIDINEKKYCDSYISTSIKINTQKAIEFGANKLIIINSESPNTLNEFIFSIWLRFRNKKFRNNYQKNLKRIKELQFSNKIKMVFLEPEKKLRITTLNNSQRIIKKTIQQGYDEACDNNDLKEFLIN